MPNDAVCSGLDIEPGERQPGETPEAWEAFQRYRAPDGPRSLAKVGQELGKSTALMERWSARWDWPARVASWDREEDRAFRKEILRDRRSVAIIEVAQFNPAYSLTPVRSLQLLQIARVTRRNDDCPDCRSDYGCVA